MSNDLIHEVEESIRQDNLQNFWKEYGAYLIAGAVLAVLFTGLITGWRSWNDKVNASQTAALMQALEQEDAVAALNQAIPGLRPNHRALAHLAAAGMLLESGETEQALAHYNSLAAASDAEPVYRDLARLMAVRTEWDAQAPDVNPQALLAALQPVWNDAKSPWRWHAREQAAVILANGLSDYAAAREHLAAIMQADKDVVRSLQERAGALHHVYGLKLSQAAPADGEHNNSKEDPEG